MREFPPIDRNAEDAALQTLFFRDSEFDGRTCRLSVANYLAFLSLRGSEIKDEINKLRTALAEPAAAHLERDLATLLRARNWRFHNIACVAIACTDPSDKLLAELWACIRAGSWSSPQLTATAAFIDPGFQQKALDLVEDSATYFKSIVSLAALLAALGRQPPSDAAQANIREAISIDRDNSGPIAVNWHANLVAAISVANPSVEARPNGTSMSGRMSGATEFQFGVQVSGSLDTTDESADQQCSTFTPPRGPNESFRSGQPVPSFGAPI